MIQALHFYMCVIVFNKLSIQEIVSMLWFKLNVNFANRLRLAEDEISTLGQRASLVDNYEGQVRRLRDDVAILTARRQAILNG